ncbi:hypothetical protein QBC35DRAFT_35518 [Podospora australis]|uniref:Uncharacterized protein n=1 Tax=Podospora australis TaxID=1536484 RepID=A0AAN6WZK1_9PEZI|nr:hypothetical protein QBC35DRAFT_35518 [Podospora australis]
MAHRSTHGQPKSTLRVYLDIVFPLSRRCPTPVKVLSSSLAICFLFFFLVTSLGIAIIAQQGAHATITTNFPESIANWLFPTTCVLLGSALVVIALTVAAHAIMWFRVNHTVGLTSGFITRVFVPLGILQIVVGLSGVVLGIPRAWMRLLPDNSNNNVDVAIAQQMIPEPFWVVVIPSALMFTIGVMQIGGASIFRGYPPGFELPARRAPTISKRAAARYHLTSQERLELEILGSHSGLLARHFEKQRQQRRQQTQGNMNVPALSLSPLPIGAVINAVNDPLGERMRMHPSAWFWLGVPSWPPPWTQTLLLITVPFAVQIPVFILLPAREEWYLSKSFTLIFPFLWPLWYGKMWYLVRARKPVLLRQSTRPPQPSRKNKMGLLSCILHGVVLVLALGTYSITLICTAVQIGSAGGLWLVPAILYPLLGLFVLVNPVDIEVRILRRRWEASGRGTVSLLI